MKNLVKPWPSEILKKFQMANLVVSNEEFGAMGKLEKLVTFTTENFRFNHLTFKSDNVVIKDMWNALDPAA
jgi:hypothetical protein